MFLAIRGAFCHCRNPMSQPRYLKRRGSSRPCVAKMNPTGNHEVSGLIPGLVQWVKDLVLPVSCGVGHRCGLDPMLLRLCHRPAATAPIGPLAWEPPCTADAALEKTKKTKKINKN